MKDFSNVRGYRNKNPGNIRHGSKWQGLAPNQTDAGFCQFVSHEYGIRAIYKLMQTYQNKYGLNSIEAIINRYAPPNENHTQNYINRCAADLGISRDARINTGDMKTLVALAKAIVSVELGGNPYPDQTFIDAYKLM
ncbi:structural protein [Proteus phage vB_PmiP_RS51pmB]|nr:structural protein [Proteus phage vB_PmiP_RS51pmB]